MSVTKESPVNDLIWGSFDFIIKGNSLIVASQSSLPSCTRKPVLGALPQSLMHELMFILGATTKGESLSFLVGLFRKEDHMLCSYTDCI